jgi:hypothetical protein
MRGHDYYDDDVEPEQRPANRKPRLWGVVLVILLVGAAVAFRAARQARDAEAMHRQVAERQAEAAREADRERGGWAQRGIMPLQDLHGAFWADAVAAERDHGPRPRFVMLIDRVERDAAGGGYDAIEDTGEPEGVGRPRLVARFKSADGLRVGDTVTARGKVGVVGRSQLVMVDCELD